VFVRTKPSTDYAERICGICGWLFTVVKFGHRLRKLLKF
jgi:hypothetical protein